MAKQSTGETIVNLCVSGERDDHRQTHIEEQQTLAGSTQRDECFPASTTERENYPYYITYNARLKSFRGWKSADVNPNELADAGFYYTGIKDWVRCFFCRGGFKDWETGHDPWIEHARWYRNCAFLKQSKGDEFIRLCLSSNIRDSENILSRDMPQQTPIIEDQLIEDMQTTASSLMLDMGYSQVNDVQAIRYARHTCTYGGKKLLANTVGKLELENMAPFLISLIQQGNLGLPGFIERASDKVLTENVLISIANAIGKNWHLLGHELGVDSVMIDHIKEEKQTAAGRIFAMLKKWTSIKENGAKADTLLRIMWESCEKYRVNVNWPKIMQLFV